MILFAEEVTWQQVAIHLGTSAVTIFTILGAVLTAWINLKGKINDNTRTTREARDEAADARREASAASIISQHTGRKVLEAIESVASGAVPSTENREQVIAEVRGKLEEVKETLRQTILSDSKKNLMAAVRNDSPKGTPEPK